jgi:hypothetical protein
MKCGGDALCFFVLFVTECDAANLVAKRNTRLQRAPLSFLFLPQSSLSHSHTVTQSHVTCHNVSHWHISDVRAPLNTRFYERFHQFKLNKRLSSTSLLSMATFHHILWRSVCGCQQGWVVDGQNGRETQRDRIRCTYCTHNSSCKSTAAASLLPLRGNTACKRHQRLLHLTMPLFIAPILTKRGCSSRIPLFHSTIQRILLLFGQAACRF